MECLIIGIKYIYPVELLKLSPNGNSSEKNPFHFFGSCSCQEDLDMVSNGVPARVPPLMGLPGLLIEDSPGKAVYSESHE